MAVLQIGSLNTHANTLYCLPVLQNQEILKEKKKCKPTFPRHAAVHNLEGNLQFEMMGPSGKSVGGDTHHSALTVAEGLWSRCNLHSNSTSATPRDGLWWQWSFQFCTVKMAFYIGAIVPGGLKDLTHFNSSVSSPSAPSKFLLLNYI